MSNIKNLVNERTYILSKAANEANKVAEQITREVLDAIPYTMGTVFRKTINDKEIDYLLCDIKVSTDGTAALIGYKRKLNGEFGKREAFITSVIYDEYKLPDYIVVVGHEPLS